MDKPVWWKGEYRIFQPKQGWVRTIQDADPAAEPKAAEPKASGKAPELSKEAKLRLQEAREAQNQRLEEQERRRHAAEANIGLPTSAKPPVAKKETLVQLYEAASVEGKQLAYNAMAKALAKEPLPKTETPVKAMPALPPWRQPPLPPAFQNVFAEHMAEQLPGMLAHALGLPMPPPAKAVNLIYGNPGPKMLPTVPVPKAPEPKAPEPKAPLPAVAVAEIAGDTTEEEGEEPTRDDLFDKD